MVYSRLRQSSTGVKTRLMENVTHGVNPNDPASIAQGFQRMGKEHPDVMQRVLQHPIMLAGAVGLAGLVAKHMLDKRAQGQQV
jgi:hypothetical protein